MSNSKNSTSSSLPAIDLILSCNVCQDTLSRIYSSESDHHGLHKGGNPEHDRITKLWLTECAHLICGKHLEGGGVPFHPDHQLPRAACPTCIAEKDDHSDKALFFINGTSPGQYDRNLPEAYFQVPPAEFLHGAPGHEALRFQYMSLIRFGSRMHERATRSANALQRWEDRKPEIVRSLSMVAPLRDELLRARQQLLSLGQDVSSIETVLHSVGADINQSPNHQQRPKTENDTKDQYRATHPQSHPILDVKTRLAQASAEDLAHLTKGVTNRRTRDTHPEAQPQQHSPAKRKRVDAGDNADQSAREPPRQQPQGRAQSRDMMPPPPPPPPPGPNGQNHGPIDHMHTSAHEGRESHGGNPHWYRSSDNPVTPNYQRSEDRMGRQSNAPQYDTPYVPSNDTQRALANGLQPGFPPVDRSVVNPNWLIQNSRSPQMVARATPAPIARSPLTLSAQRRLQERAMFERNSGGHLTNGLTGTHFRSGSSLGLSGNARSSNSYLPSYPAGHRHRQPLGEETGASPHFSVRHLPNTPSYPQPLYASSNGHVSSLDSQWSDMPRTQQSQPIRRNDSFFAAQDSQGSSHGGRGMPNSFYASTPQHYDHSRAGISTADPGSLARLRPARR